MSGLKNWLVTNVLRSVKARLLADGKALLGGEVADALCKGYTSDGERGSLCRHFRYGHCPDEVTCAELAIDAGSEFASEIRADVAKFAAEHPRAVEAMVAKVQADMKALVAANGVDVVEWLAAKVGVSL